MIVAVVVSKNVICDDEREIERVTFDF